MASRHGTILVALDGSKLAENSIPLALLLSRAFDCSLRLIHVTSDEAALDDRRRAREVFEEYAAGRAGRYGIPADTWSADVRFGHPAEAIITAASETDVRAIAVATHGRGGFRVAFLGSVADRIIRRVQVPTLVVPGVGGPPIDIEHAIVTLDGSPESELALEPSRRIVLTAGARLTLLRAYSAEPPRTSPLLSYPPAVPKQIADEAERYVASLATADEQALVREGDAAAAIVGAANERDADLVVMAATGKGVAVRLMFGSTTERVLRTLFRPLLIVPTSAQLGA